MAFPTTHANGEVVDATWANDLENRAAAALLSAAGNLSAVADAGSSRANLRVPALLPAACVATANVSLSGLQTIDGYTLTATDVVLLTGQTTASQNGVWLAASGSWTRPTEFATGLSVRARTCTVINGTLNGKTVWLLQTNAAITVDTTSQTWVQVSSAGGTSAKVVALGNITGAVACDLSLGVCFTGTQTGNVTVTFTNWPASPALTEPLLIFTQDGTGGRTITITGAIWQPAGTPPSFNTVAGAVNMIPLSSPDQGTHIYGDGDNFTPITSTQQSGTTYTFAITDADTVVESTGASAAAFTIPPNSSVAFPLGTSIEVFQYGAGQVTITAGAGVTLRSDGSHVKTAAQYATIALRQRAANEWVLAGDLA